LKRQPKKASSIRRSAPVAPKRPQQAPAQPAPQPAAQPAAAQPAAQPSGVTGEQQPAGKSKADLLALERELRGEKPPAQPGQPGAPAGEAQQPKRRRIKAPEHTIRLVIGQYWRFRAWVAARKIQLPAHLFAAVLEGTNETLVEPLVDPVAAVVEEYMPEQWVVFLQEKSPIVNLLLAMFEAEQAFGSRMQLIANELAGARTVDGSQQQPPPGPPAGGSGYPRKGA